MEKGEVMQWKAQPTIWRQWFAWRPVRTTQEIYVWFEYVERIKSDDGISGKRRYYYRIKKCL